MLDNGTANADSAHAMCADSNRAKLRVAKEEDAAGSAAADTPATK